MPAIIRHWIRASPVMLAGMVSATVTSPPRLVTKPWAPAYRTWFSITSRTALSTSPFCSRSCASAALRRRRQRPDADDRAVQRLADERRGQPGRELGRPAARAACSPPAAALLPVMPTDPTVAYLR